MNIEEKYNKMIKFFKEISKVPRNSKHEEKIADFLCDFAASRGLEYRKDDINNVLIKKKATPGYEGKKTILFQAHTDMVCEKIPDSEHDFYHDAIKVIEENGIMHADGTTLGADDGIGVSYLLLLLDDEDIPHPDIECLFTTQEEIGMYGARDFDYSDIKASYLINLDGEEENTAIVGCAGGMTINYLKTAELEDTTSNLYKLEITNLHGGHSGVDIDKGRMNSNYLAAKILNEFKDVKIVSFSGGNKDNAIPNYTIVIFEAKEEEKPLPLIVMDLVNKTEFCKEDKNVICQIENIGEHKEIQALSVDESKKIIDLLLNLKQNVIEWSKDVEGLVETSGNVGVVRVENGKTIIVESLRSSIDSEKERIMQENNKYAKSLGFDIKTSGSYPGWKYNPNSKLEKIYIDSYKKSHDGQEPIVCAIHAGVECGMIYEKLPHLDMISLGPDVKDVHTVNETLYLDSCKKMLVTLLDMIENLD